MSEQSMYDLTIEINCRTFHITVDFNYLPESAPVLSAKPEDCEEGYPEQFDINCITAFYDERVLGAHGSYIDKVRSVDITNLLPFPGVEDEIIRQIKERWESSDEQ